MGELRLPSNQWANQHKESKTHLTIGGRPVKASTVRRLHPLKTQQQKSIIKRLELRKSLGPKGPCRGGTLFFK